MDDFKELVNSNFIEYASYVVRDRAIPHIADGFKPVQRRFMQTLYNMDDGKLHKVANVSGQTMTLHPHGNVAISDAIVNMANKGYMLDTQGNFGNPLTGDPAAAERYIETRLSELAKATMFNPQLTTYVLSYDGRNKEPVTLPAKIPLVLMQGADGIAVGMATRILPHNFVELIEAEIALLQGETASVLPDFIQGGLMDASEYADGKGKIKLRAKIEIPDDKTLVIREIPYSTTTESIMQSIEEAARKGKIKIDSIHDYTTQDVEIEIKLPRGQHAQGVIDALYGFTDCEVSLSSQIIVIKDNLPWETTVTEVLKHHVGLVQGYLRSELEMELAALQEKIFNKSLERIFIENRLYKKIEELTSYEDIHEQMQKSLKPYVKDLTREVTEADRERLLNIPIRRISRFDLNQNDKDIKECDAAIKRVLKDLKNIPGFTISYFEKLLVKYGKDFKRRTQIEAFSTVDMKAISTKNIKVGIDVAGGFIGTKVSAETMLECTNHDKILLLYKDGSYKVVNIVEKLYVGPKALAYVGVADKKTELRCIYKEKQSGYCYAKAFIVNKFILDKEYNYLEEGTVLEVITSDKKASFELLFVPKERQKIASIVYSMSEVPVKGVTSKGIRIANREVKRVKAQKGG